MAKGLEEACIQTILGTHHGTFVNGEQIAERELQSGHRIALGKERVELVYYTDEGETAGKEPNRQDAKSAKKASRE